MLGKRRVGLQFTSSVRSVNKLTSIGFLAMNTLDFPLATTKLRLPTRNKTVALRSLRRPLCFTSLDLSHEVSCGARYRRSSVDSCNQNELRNIQLVKMYRPGSAIVHLVMCSCSSQRRRHKGFAGETLDFSDESAGQNPTLGKDSRRVS